MRKGGHLFLWSRRRHLSSSEGVGLGRARTEGSHCRGVKDDGALGDAVEALGFLVEQRLYVSVSLFCDVLRRCIQQKDLDLGRRVHALTGNIGYESSTVLANHVIRLYASRGRVQEAAQVFSKLVTPDAFVWLSIILAHVEHRRPAQAVKLYGQMRYAGADVDSHVYGAVLKACASTADLVSGKQVHADLLQRAVQPNVYVGNCLVDMYAKCGSLEDARKVFDSLPTKDVVSWTAMIAGYAEHRLDQEALALYALMQQEGITADRITFSGLLKACAGVGALSEGRKLHNQIQGQGLEADSFIGSSLVHMYAKCGCLEDAREVFDRLVTRDVVTWTAMIAGYAQHGRFEESLGIYASMQEEGMTAANHVTLVWLLKACAELRALHQGKELHAQVLERDLEADVVIANCLVDMYAKCGSLEDARQVFDRLPTRDVVTWTAMIAGYAQNGFGDKSLSLYASMRHEGITPADYVTYGCLLGACASTGALRQGKDLHAQIQERGLEANMVVCNSLVDMYAKCGSLEDARRVFDKLPQRDVVTWNTMFAGYAQSGLGEEALALHERMEEDGITEADHVTFACLLKACAGLVALPEGKKLHSQVRHRGLQDNLVIANCIIDMYAKCGCLEDAREVFDKLPRKDLVTWTAMIGAYAEQGLGEEAISLYTRMQQEGMTSADCVTLACVLRACASIGALQKGQQLHTEIEDKGLEADIVVCNALIDMYAKCGSLEDARKLFDDMSTKDVVSWNTMIAGYTQHGFGQESLALYARMTHDGNISPNHVTYVCILKACTNIGALHLGKEILSHIRERKLDEDVVIGNCLVDMFAKCGSIEDARMVFDKLPVKDVRTWNAMLAGYNQSGLGEESLSLYARMQQEHLISADQITYVCILKACGSIGALLQGKNVHGKIKARNLESDVVIGNCLVDMYARCGSIEDARRVFDRMPTRDVVSWTTMIAGYVEHGSSQEALTLYGRMQQENLTPPDQATYASLLKACANAGALDQGKQLHVEIQERALESSVVIGNCLVDMYAKCGSLENACSTFGRLVTKDVVTWTAMISGYAQHGYSQEAVDSYKRMQLAGTKPDGVTFLSLLSACTHAGLVEKGVEYFESMARDYGISPRIEHYVSMIDLFGRAGCFTMAEDFLVRMPMQPNVALWLCLMGACRKYGNVVLGELAFNGAVDLEPQHPAAYVLMSQIYADAGLQDRAMEVHTLRQEQGAWKQPGQSWIECNQEVYSFAAGDCQHPEHKNLYDFLGEVRKQLKL